MILSHQNIKRLFLFTSPFILFGCETTLEKKNTQVDSYLSLAQSHMPYSANIQRALDFIKEGELKEASREINIALDNFPEQVNLHLLNGLIYEQMAENGFKGKATLAKVAYEKAVALDPTNWYGYYMLGRLELKKRRYVEAQENLAHALLLKPDDVKLLHELAVASYYARDLTVARSCLEKALALNDNFPLHRTASLIFAATGDQKKAEDHFLVFMQSVGEKDPDVIFLKGRMRDWEKVHKRAHFYKVANTAADASQQKPSSTAPEEEKEPSETKTALVSSEKKDSSEDDMVILDCYILRVSEAGATSKGNNILEAFTNGITITPQSSQYSYVKTTGGPNPGNVLTQTFTRGISWGNIVYNLNIANVQDQRIEVLGRPTVSTYLSKTAKFNSGDIYKGGLTGNFGGGAIVDIPTGVIMTITPTKINGDKVTLDIEVEGSLIQGNDPLATGSLASQTLKISQTKINTTLTLKFGQTGMLGGIYQQVGQYQKEGVPGLWSLPGIQYLFSQELTLNEIKTDLFLVTPRRPDHVEEAIRKHFSIKKQRENQESLKKLHEEQGLWADNNFHPNFSPALIPMLDSLAPLYKEYRTGDVIPVSWGKRMSFEEELSIISAFLYY